MDDWYNDSLPRYPRILIQKEQETPLQHQTYQTEASRKGGNVIRIRVHGRRSEGEEIEPPTVTVHRYNDNHTTAHPHVTAKTVGPGGITPVPVQVRRMVASPVTNIAHAQRHHRSPVRTSFPEPMKALPLTSLLQDFNANDTRRTHQMPPHNQSKLSSISLLDSSKDSFFNSFEQEFDRFTSEYAARAKSPTIIKQSNDRCKCRCTYYYCIQF